MRNSSKLLCFVAGASVAGLAAALAETPTPAQQQAIRSNCVSDFRAHCSGVPTGGMDALICLEKNVDGLSPACKSAVEAVEPAESEASSEAAPAATETVAKSSGGSQPKQTSADTTTTAASDKATQSSDKSQATASADAVVKPSDSEPKLTFRQEMAIAAGACAVDFRLFCPNLPVGHGNVLFCLQVHAPRLAPACRAALLKLGVNL